jgi:signal transduction histidine kinase
MCSFRLIALPFDISDIDSLIKASYKLQGKEKVKCFNNISELLWYVNIDSSIYYAKTALAIAEKINDQKGIANSYNSLGGAYTNHGDNYNGLKYYHQSLELVRKLGLKKSEGNILHNLSSIYSAMGVYDKALDYNYRSLKISEELNNTKGIALAYLINAYCYNQQDMYDKALNFYFQALAIFKKLNDLHMISSTLDDIGSAYNTTRKLFEARYYFNQAMKIARSSEDLFLIAAITDNLGINFRLTHQYDSALFYHHYSIILFNKLKSEQSIGPYVNLARLYLEINMPDSAKYYLDKSNQSVSKDYTLRLMIDIYNLYTEYYKKTNNLSKALEYFKLSIQIKDSMQSEKNINRLLNMQIDYEREKLKAEKEIQDLKMKRNQNQRNFSIVFAVLIMMLTILLYSRFILKKRTNRLLLEKNNQLQIANQTKDKFFTIISHDLKNQLIAFQNISQVLAENFSQIAEEKKQHLVIRINNSAITLYSVLENLLTWSSAQLQGFEYQPELLNIKHLTDEICSELDLQSDKKSIRVINKLATETYVLADKNMTRDILRNLIHNAIKYSPENSEVMISTKEFNKMLEISIIDNGIGISEADLKKLFRLDVNHKEIGHHKEKGSGLGLIIVKDFVEKMGGNLWVESIEGKGSIFKFSLPINL